MPFWFALLLFTVSTFVGELLRPKPPNQTPKKPGIGDFQLPTSSETRPYPVIWGTVLQKGPNVLWRGDYAPKAITQKVRGQFFLMKKVQVGWRYHIGLAYSLCWGVVDAIEAVLVGDKELWTGSANAGTITIDKPDVFGGDKEEGGYSATLEIYSGTELQAASAYLKAQNGGKHPAYRNISYVVQRGASQAWSGYIGTSVYLKPIAFRVRRCPNNLSLASGGHNINGDANPAEMLFELLTNSDWGMGLNAADVDLASFQACGNTLAGEGAGLSILWDNTQTIEAMIKDICRHVDALIYIDLTTGKYKMLLARNDYDASTLPVFDESNIIALTSFTRGAIDETTNEIRITYTDRAAGFIERTAEDHDPANFFMQGYAVASEDSYPGYTNADNAQRVAARDLKTLSYSLAKHTIRVNRKGNSLHEGSVYRWTWPEDGINEMVMRVLSIKYGTLDAGTIEINAVEDIFALVNSSFSAPAAAPASFAPGAAAQSSSLVVREQPFLMAGDDSARVIVAAEAADTSQKSLDVYLATDGATFTAADERAQYTPTGTLAGSMSRLTGGIDTGSITVAPGTLLDRLAAASPAEIAQGVNLFLVDDELCAFEQIADAGGSKTLTRIWRGLLDTTPADHAAGARVWFLSYGDSAPDATFNPGQTVTAKVASSNGRDTTAITGATPTSCSIVQRATRPIAGRLLTVNGSATSTTIPATGDVALAWLHSDRTRQTTVIAQSDTSITAIEPGAKYRLKIYGQLGALLRTQDVTSGSSYTYTNATETADAGALQSVLTFVLYSVREGLDSYQAQIRQVTRPAGAAGALPSFTPGGTYAPLQPGNATSINGSPVSASAPSGGQTLTYNSTTGQYEPTTPAALPTHLTMGGDVTGETNANTVTKIQGRSVASTAPTDGQAIVYDAASSTWKPGSPAVGSAPPSGASGGDLANTYPNPTLAKIMGRLLKDITAAGFVSDNFNDNSRDATLWNYYGGLSTNVLEQNNRLEIGSTSGTAYRGYQTVNGYDVRGHYTSVNIVSMSLSSGGQSGLQWDWAVGARTWMAEMWVTSAGKLQMIVEDGSNGVDYNSNTLVWNSVTHKYIRIRASSDGSTVFFDTSPDGSTWTNQGSYNNTNMHAGENAVKVSILNYNNTNTCIFDDFNSDVSAADVLSTGDVLAWNGTTGVTRFENTPIHSVKIVTSDPTTAPTGLLTGFTVAQFNTSNGKLWVWNTSTSAWVNISSGASLASGQAVLSADFTITSASLTYQDTGLSITLPSAGTYIIHADVRAQLATTVAGVSIAAKFYNSTDGADVANTETLIFYFEETNVTRGATGHITSPPVTVTASKTIKLYVERNGSGWTSSLIRSDVNGRTRLS